MYAEMNSDGANNLAQRMARGAIVGATAPVSMPLMIAYAAAQPYVEPPPKKSKRCYCGHGYEM